MTLLDPLNCPIKIGDTVLTFGYSERETMRFISTVVATEKCSVNVYCERANRGIVIRTPKQVVVVTRQIQNNKNKYLEYQI